MTPEDLTKFGRYKQDSVQREDSSSDGDTRNKTLHLKQQHKHLNLRTIIKTLFAF